MHSQGTDERQQDVRSKYFVPLREPASGVAEQITCTEKVVAFGEQLFVLVAWGRSAAMFVDVLRLTNFSSVIKPDTVAVVYIRGFNSHHPLSSSSYY